MPNQTQQNPSQASGSLDYDLDILNDSISMNMVDDSFEYGNESTLMLPSQPTGLPSPGRPKNSIPSRTGNFQSSQGDQHPEEIRRRSRSRTPHQDARLQEPTDSDDEADMKPSESSARRETSRNLDLEKERDWLREINQLLLKSADEMDKVKEKLENVQSAAQTSHELLDLYSKILTQTEHTKDLLSNSDWQGLTRDNERRAQLREQERIRLARERELEEEMELERQRRQQEIEAEAERLRQQNQSQKSNFSSAIPTGKPRGRGTGGTTAGRTVRGKSRIGRIAR